MLNLKKAERLKKAEKLRKVRGWRRLEVEGTLEKKLGCRRVSCICEMEVDIGDSR